MQLGQQQPNNWDSIITFFFFFLKINHHFLLHFLEIYYMLFILELPKLALFIAIAPGG